MIYLSGCIIDSLDERVGYMMTPQMGNHPADWASRTWAADTGMFSDPAGYTDGAYLDWLDARRQYQGSCLFATAPDVVGNWDATWRLARPMLNDIQECGYLPAVVLQDGCQRLPAVGVPYAVFIGGSTAWKLSDHVRELVEEAKRRGKWVHMGRVNSLRRFRYAKAIGCNSVDGTFLKFGPDVNHPKLRRWIDRTPIPLPVRYCYESHR